jgi:hypothetical protein
MHGKRSSRRFQIESLEARQMMAADLYIDFGSAFNWNASQAQHIFQVEMLSDSRVNGPSTDVTPDQLTSLQDALVSRHLDYDFNGVVDSLDADALAQDVADMVSRIYDPFAVNVKLVGSTNMNQVIDKLDDHATNDAYILLAGRQDPTVDDEFRLGVAKTNIGNTKDNVAFAFVEDLLDKATSLAAGDTNAWQYIVSTLARTVAHEAGHTFGLKHLLTESEGATADQALMGSSDMMFLDDTGRFKFMNLATRWNGLLNDDGNPQNSFEVLAANVGLRSRSPAYVTGTGAHDKILIEGLGNNQAQVTVSAFRDAATRT